MESKLPCSSPELHKFWGELSMEPNLATWLDQASYEDWQTQLFRVMYDDFQEYFDNAKEEIAESYGN